MIKRFLSVLMMGTIMVSFTACMNVKPAYKAPDSTLPVKSGSSFVQDNRVYLINETGDGREDVTPEAIPKVKYIIIKDIRKQQETEQKDPGLVNEFLQLLKAQKYSKLQQQWEDEYFVKLMGQDEIPVLEISFGARSVTLDRDFDFEGTTLKKGSYEVEEWITRYLGSYYNGQALNPSYIRLPAILKMGGELFGEELVDRGSTKINLYDVIPRLKDFVNLSIGEGHFEIVGYKAVHGFAEMESEAEAVRAGKRCISIIFSSSEDLFEIDSKNDFKSFAQASGMTIAALKDEPCIYRILTDRMIFTVKADKEFDRQFNDLFDLNASVRHQVAPDEIKTLSDSKKPGFMEYVSKNLGLNSIELRPDYSFERKPIRPGDGSLYELLDFTDSYTTRLLIFQQGAGKQAGYIGNIDIKGWGDNDGYKTRSVGDKTFIVGEKNLKGHGTGFLAYTQDWYLIKDSTVRTALSIPSIYGMGETYGFNLELKDLKQSVSGTSLTADYELSKYYKLKLPIADQYGNVTVRADKQAELVWDESQGCFIPENKFDDQGIQDFADDSGKIREQCSQILEKYYTQMEKDIDALVSEPDDAKRWEADNYKAFLGDCDPGEKAEHLKRKLTEAYPEGI